MVLDQLLRWITAIIDILMDELLFKKTPFVNYDISDFPLPLKFVDSS